MLNLILLLIIKFLIYIFRKHEKISLDGLDICIKSHGDTGRWIRRVIK